MSDRLPNHQVNNWSEYTLNEVFSFASGLSKSREEFGYGFPFLSFKEVFENFFLPRTLQNLANTTEKERMTCSIRRGDVFLTRTSETQEELGMSSVALMDYPNATFNGFTKRLRPLGNVDIWPKYAGFYFRSPRFRAAVTSMSSITTRASLNNDMMSALKIILPSIEEQKAIAAVLSSLDDKIDLLHRQNKTLEAMTETLFRHWFMEEAQESWQEKTLKEVCVINNGYAFQSPTYTESGQKILRTLNFSNHWIDLKGFVHISDNLAKSFEKYYLKRNDFLLVMVGASLGNFAIVTKDVLPLLQNQNMWCFRALEGVPQHFLNFVLRKLIDETLHGASGSAREFFQKGVFYDLKIVVPPLDLMERFEVTAEALFSKIELNRYQIRTLETLRDTLLPKLMSGEVRVAV